MNQRLEYLEIQADDNIIDMIDTFADRNKSFTVESYWDEFTDIMSQLRTQIEQIRDKRLIIFCRCEPCDFKFEDTIHAMIDPKMFDHIECPQCGNKDILVSKTINYRAYEKQEYSPVSGGSLNE